MAGRIIFKAHFRIGLDEDMKSMFFAQLTGPTTRNLTGLLLGIGDQIQNQTALR